MVPGDLQQGFDHKGQIGMPNAQRLKATMIDHVAAAEHDTPSRLARFDQLSPDTITIDTSAVRSIDKGAEIVSPTTSPAHIREQRARVAVASPSPRPSQEMEQAEAALRALVERAPPAIQPPPSNADDTPNEPQVAQLDRLRDSGRPRAEAFSLAWAARTDASKPAMAARTAGPSTQQRSTPAPHFRVQIAALRKEVDAHSTWNRFQSTLGLMLTGMEPYFERAETSSGLFYRVQVGPFQTRSDAQGLCADLEERDVTCFIVAH